MPRINNSCRKFSQCHTKLSYKICILVFGKLIPLLRKEEINNFIKFFVFHLSFRMFLLFFIFLSFMTKLSYTLLVTWQKCLQLRCLQRNFLGHYILLRVLILFVPLTTCFLIRVEHLLIN